MSLPVSPANYIYSHFEHVSGVPAPDGVRGVAITKLKILDVLIEQLSKIKHQPAPELESAPSDDRIDAMIEQYRSQLRQSQAVSAATPYKVQPAVASGLIVDLVA
jgi:hypothetical protein